MKTLLKSTVLEFFRQRTGTFLVILGVLFGFMSSVEHRAFAIFFLSSNAGIAWLGLIWFSYFLLCAQFIIQLWKQPAYTFIYDCRLLSMRNRVFWFGITSLGFLLPIICYGIYLISIAISGHVVTAAWKIFPLVACLMVMLAMVAEWRIRNPGLYHKKESGLGIRKVSFRPVSYTYWTLEYLFRQKGITLLIGKTGTVLVFSATLLYFGTGDYDLRLPAIGLTFGYLLNIGLSLELYHWDNSTWLWGRSLPIAKAKRLLQLAVVHALLLLPETGLLFRCCSLDWFQILQLYLLGLSAVLAFHSQLYKSFETNNMDEMTKLVLYGFVLFTVLVLYKVPLLLLSSILWTIILLRFTRIRQF